MEGRRGMTACLLYPSACGYAVQRRFFLLHPQASPNLMPDHAIMPYAMRSETHGV